MKSLLLCAFLVTLAGVSTLPAQPTPKPAAKVDTTAPSDRNYRAHIPYQIYYADYLALMQGKPVDLIFVGDSITEQWRWGSGNPVWTRYYADRALDFGLGSDTTQNTIWRLQNIDLKGFKPKVAVVLIGTNNFNDTPEDIAKGVKGVADATLAKFPGIKVVLQSILPNARATEKMAAANALIKPLANGHTIFYLDLAAQFTPEGDNWKGLDRGKLHLTTAGYDMWAQALNAFLPQVFSTHP